MRTSQEADVLDWNSGIEKEDEFCPNCKSDKISKQGFRKTISGNRQKYRCEQCKKYFVLEPIKYTKINAKMITLVMDLYFKGNSLRDIKDTIKQFYNIDLHHETIRRYILKFTNAIDKYANKLKPKLSNKIHVDEQKVRTKHNEFLWSWNAIDRDTRFLIANNVTKERGISDAEQILNKVKDVAGKIDLTITTDKLASYPHAIGHVFHKINDWAYNQKAVKHIADAGISQVHKNNNMIERYHNEFREFDKVRRGIDHVKEWNVGFKIYHNFIKENSTLGETPSERAGIFLNPNNNRWLSLLKKSLQADDMRQS